MSTVTWWKNRRDFYDDSDAYRFVVSIAVVGYNRLEEKTKVCVESILAHTAGIEYQLILVDSGSTDGTFEYFSEVDHPCKKVLKLDENRGLGYALSCAWKHASGRYLAFVANDCIVTECWLENLLNCIKSDPKIGMVCPAASNVSNAQSVYIGEYSSFDGMQKLAKKHNVSNSALWEYRPRLINPVALYRAEVLDLIGYMDPGFVHNFGEDDLARGIHRNGYRMVLCKDTFIEHNHVQSERDADREKQNLEEGKKVFQEKYHGIDPWDDINNYVLPYITQMQCGGFSDKSVNVLGVNIRCGTPFLDVLTRLETNGIADEKISFSAYTSDVKFYTDLVAFPARVDVGGVEGIADAYSAGSMDIVMTTEDIDSFSTASEHIGNLMRIVKNGGYVLFPLRNKDDVLAYIDHMIGEKNNEDVGATTSSEDVLQWLEENDADQVWITDERYQEGLKEALRAQLGEALPDDDGLFVERFWFLVKKKA